MKQKPTPPENQRELYETVYEDAGMSWISENVRLLQELLDCIRRGDVQKMESLLDVLPSDLRARFGETPLRHLKNLVISLIQIMGITAIESGAGSSLCIRYMERLVQQTEASDSPETIRALADEAKLLFCRLTAEQITLDVPDRRIGRAVRFIHDNTSRRISRKELAELAGMSEAYFSKRFRSLTGKTVSEYIRHTKIRQAKRMLADTDETLAQIASYLDFSTQNYFQTVFKQIEGCTPLEYRRQHMK